MGGTGKRLHWQHLLGEKSIVDARRKLERHVMLFARVSSAEAVCLLPPKIRASKVLSLGISGSWIPRGLKQGYA